MSGLIEVLANIFELIANMGAGSVSYGIAYEPKVPEELLK